MDLWLVRSGEDGIVKRKLPSQPLYMSRQFSSRAKTRDSRIRRLHHSNQIITRTSLRISCTGDFSPFGIFLSQPMKKGGWGQF